LEFAIALQRGLFTPIVTAAGAVVYRAISRYFLKKTTKSSPPPTGDCCSFPVLQTGRKPANPRYNLTEIKNGGLNTKHILLQ
jgi:hypothetical protein